MCLKRILFILFFSIVASAESRNDCSGFVSGLDYSGDTFYGKCFDTGYPEWGEWYFNGSDDSYSGFFHDDGRIWIGTYYWENEDYRSGESFKDVRIKNEYRYNYFGRYTFTNSNNSFIGYMYQGNLNGFGAYFWEKDYSGKNRTSEVGIFTHNEDDGVFLNGYGARTLDDQNIIIGFWQGGRIANGDFYIEDESENVEKYSSRNGKAYGPYTMNSSDYSRYNNIVDYLSNGLDDITSLMNQIDDQINKYNDVSSQYIASYESEGKNEIIDDELVKSTQELLVELGYSIGEIDGILGEKTRSAIKAFEFQVETEMTGVPTENLLVALQLAIQSQKATNTQSIDRDPVLIATGTGFYVNKKNIVSNNHVIENCIYQTDSNNNELNLVVADVVNDLALLEGPVRNNSLNISPNPPLLGEKVYVSGFPFNSDLKSFMITSGNVSSLTGLGKNFSEFSHTAPSQPGNSGGPIVNEYGSLVGVLIGGVNAANFLKADIDTGEVEGDLPQNINFGIKNTVLKSLLADNNITISERNPYFSKSQKDIAEISKSASVLIRCYGYYE